MATVAATDNDVAAMGSQIIQLRACTRDIYAALGTQITDLTAARDGLDQVGGLDPGETVTLATTLGAIITALSTAKSDLHPMLP